MKIKLVIYHYIKNVMNELTVPANPLAISEARLNQISEC